MSSSESPPPQRQRSEEAEVAEGLSEGDGMGGEMGGAGAPSSAARQEGPPASTLDPSGAIPQESAAGHVDRPHPSDPSSGSSGSSAPSTSSGTGASSQTSLPEAAGDMLAFPLLHRSDPATSRTPLASRRLRQTGQERSYAPEFLHLNAAFQSSFKILGEQVAAGFNMVKTCMCEHSSRLDRLHSDARESPNNLFFQSMLRSMEKLTLDQQMRVMNACHAALVQVMSEGEIPPPPNTSATTRILPAQAQLPSRPQMSSPLFSSLSSFPSPFSVPPTPTTPPPAQPPVLSLTAPTPQPSMSSPTIDVVQPSSPSATISTPDFTDL